jgi:cytochrome c oxidase subunit 3
MAWAVRCAQLGKQKGLRVLLALTLLGGFGFLGIKAVEYEHKWKHGLLWGKSYRPVAMEHSGGHADAHHAPPEPAPGGPPLPGGAGSPKNVQVFFSIYFLMTGLHGLHVIGGMGAIAWLLFRASRGAFGPDYFTPVDLVGLYWHLVDLIWIYLFPLLYLIH